MGKRELLIVLAFVVVGAALYRVTAPPAKEHAGVSLGRILDEIRADIRRDAESARYVHSDVITPAARVTELRLSGVTGRMVVTGEERTDIAFELQVESTGPDEATATDYAMKTVLVEDDLGDTLGLRVSYPPEARQTTEIALRVPRSMRVAVDGGKSAEFKDLRAIRLEGVVGETTAEGIAEEVGGSHRNGRLTVTGAGSITLNLQASRAVLSKVTGGIMLNANRGETRIVDSQGPIEVEQSNNELRIEQPRGAVRVSGSGGRIELLDPQDEVRIDVRRTEVEVRLSRAVPMTVMTADEPLRLVLDGPPPIVVDAVITGSGDLIADDFNLSGVTARDETSLTHAFGDQATVRVSLRNRRDDIEIQKGK
jgi:hypothetical protein